jgi:hypothetical protein
MNSIPHNSKISIEPALTHQQSIEYHHLRLIKSRSMKETYLEWVLYK